MILLATGSEVSLCVKAHVVSMPSWDLFEAQNQTHPDSVLPPHVTARVALEEASTFGWERYVGLTGKVLGMPTFGARAPTKVVQGYFGFSATPLSKPLKYNYSRFVERDRDRARRDC